MTIKKYLILTYIILIGFRIPVAAIPTKNEVVNFINNRFPPKKTQGLTRNKLISDVTNEINTSIVPLYKPGEIVYLLEASLDAFGLAFYTDENRNIIYTVACIENLLEFFKKRVPSRTLTRDINQALSDVFNLQNRIDTKSNSNFHNLGKRTFYRDWVNFFKDVPHLLSHNYVGGIFFKAKRMTIYYNPDRSNHPFPVPVLSGVPIPSFLISQNLEEEAQSLISTQDISSRDVLEENVNDLTYEFDETSQNELSMPNSVICDMIMEMPLPHHKIASVKREIVTNSSGEFRLVPKCTNFEDQSLNGMSVTNTFISPIVNPAIAPIFSSSSKNYSDRVEAIVGILESFRRTYENDDKFAGKYDFFSSEY